MYYFNYKQLFQKVMGNIRIFSQINFEAINLLQNANLNKNVLQKADLSELKIMN